MVYFKISDTVCEKRMFKTRTFFNIAMQIIELSYLTEYSRVIKIKKKTNFNLHLIDRKLNYCLSQKEYANYSLVPSAPKAEL